MKIISREGEERQLFAVEELDVDLTVFHLGPIAYKGRGGSYLVYLAPLLYQLLSSRGSG